VPALEQLLARKDEALLVRGNALLIAQEMRISPGQLRCELGARLFYQRLKEVAV
jgi:hypothetical protein